MITKEAQQHPFLNGGGEMGERIRSKDWSTSPIGTPDTWPQGLRTTVSILLNSRFPMFVWWGEDLMTIYNDAYCPIAGEKHPELLGKSGKEAWKEIWQDLSPLVKSVFSGESTWAEDQVLYINRRGYVEETYFTFSYSPIWDDSGKVAGLYCACIETTEKVLAATKLTESERNLRSTILQSPVAMCILRGPTFIVEIANDRMYELWGRDEAVLLNRPIFDGLPEATGKGLEQLLTHVYTTGEAYVGKARPITVPREGVPNTVYVDFVYEPFREGDGSISGVIAVATDVTEQVIARRRLEETEVLLQQRVAERTADLEKQKVFIASILEASMDGIYALKAVRNSEGAVIDFVYLFANNNIAKQLNLEVNQMIGSSMLALIPENRANGFFELFCTLLQTSETLRGETHFVAQGIDSWYGYVIVPIDKETVVVSTEDITEKKRAVIQIEEQRNLLDNILRNSSNGISVSKIFRDDKSNVVDALTILANDAAIKYIGLPKEVYLSKRATEIEPNIIGSPYYQNCIKTLQTGESFLMQYQMKSTGKWLEVTVSKLDEDHLIHVFTDVTPIKAAQLQLEKYVEELKRSNQNLEEFAYAASHDLKEPVRKVHLFSNMLKQSIALPNEEQLRLFGRVEDATERMSLLIDDLLDYSHVSMGVDQVNEIDLSKKVAMVLKDLELLIQEKDGHITVGALPAIKGHRRQLQQLFHNLIQNALKYSKKDTPPQITITSEVVRGNETSFDLSEEDWNKSFHLISVKDNGIGFEQEHAAQIFQMFKRLHGKAEYQGSGVGLAIVKKVVTNHSGYIRAEGKPGEGAVFEILLPTE